MEGPAIGCMRLSTLDHAPEHAASVLEAALEAGVRLLDTADVYAPRDDAIGHNERLISGVLREWKGPRIFVATKGGLRRPGGRWVPDGRAKHLRTACEASLRALGVSCIDLYQLHAVDPKTPISTSVRALAKLQRDGLVNRVGLCNVTVEQIEQARAHVEIAAVQVDMSVWDMSPIRGGVVQYCTKHGIALLFHSPLGGAKRKARVPRYSPILAAKNDERSAADVALAWLHSLGGVPLPGPTTVRTARACAKMTPLGKELLERIDAHHCEARQVRIPIEQRRPKPQADGDVVMIGGLQGSGKTTLAQEFVARGYVRLNRDERGGTLKKLHRQLDTLLNEGNRRVVLDNTYTTRAIRNEVIEIAWNHGVPARLLWMDVPVETARAGIVQRILSRTGRLLDPDEIKAQSKTDPSVLSPSIHGKFVRTLERPVEDEGVSIEWRSRARGVPEGPSWVALDLEILRGVPTEALREQLTGCKERVIAVGWCPAERPAPELDAWAKVLNVAIELEVCTHPAGPLSCWCRPPMPGLLLHAAQRNGLQVRRCTFVAGSSFARRFAAACGVETIVDVSS